MALFSCDEQPIDGDRVKVEQIRPGERGKLQVWEVSVITDGSQRLSKAPWTVTASSEEKDPAPRVFWAENGGSKMGQEKKCSLNDNLNLKECYFLFSGKFFFFKDYRQGLLPSEADEACVKIGGKQLAEVAEFILGRDLHAYHDR